MVAILRILRDFDFLLCAHAPNQPGGGGGAALNILTGMCEYGVSKQTIIEGVG